MILRKILPLILFTCVSLIANGQIQKDKLAEKYAAEITSGDLSSYLHVLASDSLEGRETGHPGQKKAAKYISEKFKEFGLEPGMKTPNGPSYFQEFELIRKAWDDVSVKIKKDQKVFLKDFYVYGDLNIPKEVKAEVVFAGYGIDATKYSDYVDSKSDERKGKPLDIKGKAVIILPGEPMVNGKSLVTGDSNLSSWANDWRKKVALAKSKGALAVFFVVGKNQKDFDERLSVLKEHIAKPTLGFSYKERPSAFFIPLNMAAEMLGTTSDKLVRYNELNSKLKKGIEIQTKKKSNPVKLEPAKIEFKCSVIETKLTTENVLGFIEGTDKKDEILILTAHYDHLGIENGKICYGADDDGSGTAALLEIAQAFGKAKREGHGPRRSILIMPVTAEEKGLMGSEYYSDFPVYPLKNTVADLNVDMIGRLDNEHKLDTNYIYLIGSDRLSTDLHQVSEDVNKAYSGIHLDYRFNSFNDPNRFYFRSDHYNFAKNRIPVIFYFSGVHEDYHKPTDTVDKILFPKAAKITQLIFFTAWELANMEKRIEANVHEE